MVTMAPFPSPKSFSRRRASDHQVSGGCRAMVRLSWRQKYFVTSGISLASIAVVIPQRRCMPAAQEGHPFLSLTFSASVSIFQNPRRGFSTLVHAQQKVRQHIPVISWVVACRIAFPAPLLPLGKGRGRYLVLVGWPMIAVVAGREGCQPSGPRQTVIRLAMRCGP